MIYRVIVLDEARHDLRRETRYSIKHWGPAHAKRYMAELRARLRALKSDARLHAIYDDTVRVMTWKGSRVVYSLDEEAGLVTILAVTSIHQPVESVLSRR